MRLMVEGHSPASEDHLDPGVLVGGLHADMYPNRSHRLTAAELIRERAKRG